MAHQHIIMFEIADNDLSVDCTYAVNCDRILSQRIF